MTAYRSIVRSVSTAPLSVVHGWWRVPNPAPGHRTSKRSGSECFVCQNKRQRLGRCSDMSYFLCLGQLAVAARWKRVARQSFSLSFHDHASWPPSPSRGLNQHATRRRAAVPFGRSAEIGLCRWPEFAHESCADAKDVAGCSQWILTINSALQHYKGTFTPSRARTGPSTLCWSELRHACLCAIAFAAGFYMSLNVTSSRVGAHTTIYIPLEPPCRLSHPHPTCRRSTLSSSTVQDSLLYSTISRTGCSRRLGSLCAS